MSGQQPDPGPVLTWILGTISVGGALYAMGRRIFNTVTRAELKEIIEAQDQKFLQALNDQREAFERVRREERDERLRLHGENRETVRETFERISDVEQGLARIEGQLQK